MRFLHLAVMIGVLSLVACSNHRAPSTTTHNDIIQGVSHNYLADNINTMLNLQQQHQEWQGVPYVLGGNSKLGIDCSAFTQITLKQKFGINLPRTTTEQAKIGGFVQANQLQAGDLVFFKTGRGPNGKHVGIYVKDGQFIHASSQGGVMYSKLSSPYWANTYWQARRL